MIALGAHVNTDLGEGFLVGRNLSRDNPCYSVRLFDGIRWEEQVGNEKIEKIVTLVHTLPSTEQPKVPSLRTVELIDNYPVNHPNIPKGLQNYIDGKMPKGKTPFFMHEVSDVKAA